MHDAAEQPRRRWLVRLAALQACLVVAVVTLRQKPRPGTELLQHSLRPRELGYRAAKKRSGRAPGAALTTHLRGPLPTNAWWLDLARSDADDAAAAASAGEVLACRSAERPFPQQLDGGVCQSNSNQNDGIIRELADGNAHQQGDAQ